MPQALQINAQITLASYPGSIGKGRRPTVKVLKREWGKTKMGLDDSPVRQARSRIIIADDHPLFRSAIRHTLEGHTDLEVVAEAANGREALEHCRRVRPELVLMDIRMPEMDGIAATQAIKREFPETLVLIFTAIDESVGLSDSLEAGAAGYVLKHAPAAQILNAVRKVLAGETPLDDEVAMRLLMSLMKSGPKEEGEHKAESMPSSTSEIPLVQSGGSQPADTLTLREIEVLRLVAEGQTNQQIARNLFISVSTTKRHIQRISAKLGVCDRVQAAVSAIELGLLDERNGGQE
jgi:DNA-binding NarL/FixJ family response regulator